MGELADRIEELLRRTKRTTKSRYLASERLERHHKLSQWTVALLSCALIFIPMVQAFDVQTGYSPQLLNFAQAIAAVLVLVYSLLLGQEGFVLKADSMHRNGVELGRLARTLAGLNGRDIPDDEYQRLVDQYYGILEKYENHKPIDYQFAKLATDKPKVWHEWPGYLGAAAKAYLLSALSYSHYLVAIFGVAAVFIFLLRGMLSANAVSS
jgi:hypothetical protein